MAGDFYLPPGFALDERQWAALRDLGWGDPVLTLSRDEEIQPRNHTRSWPVERLPEACAHVLLTLMSVYGFHEDDPLRVSLDPFT